MRESTLRLILVPSLITLAVTLLRLTGELRGWSRVWFNPAPGGPLAPVGIVWLVFVFGAYFAVKLARSGQGPSSAGRTFGMAALAIALLVGLSLVPIFLKFGFYARLGWTFAACAATALVPYRAWPELFRTLLAYGIAARLPVIVVMGLAMAGNWGTHYDAAPPDLPADIGVAAKFVWIGLIPQLTVWIGFTIQWGMLVGGFAAVVASRRPASAATQA
jgi:hypothetical protein